MLVAIVVLLGFLVGTSLGVVGFVLFMPLGFFVGLVTPLGFFVGLVTPLGFFVGIVTPLGFFVGLVTPLGFFVGLVTPLGFFVGIVGTRLGFFVGEIPSACPFTWLKNAKMLTMIKNVLIIIFPRFPLL